MAKSRYERELKLLESEDAQSGGHDDHGHGGHGGGHDDHGGGHGADHGHGGGHGHDDHGHGGGHGGGHDDHGGHGDGHGHGGGHGGHDDHGHGGHGHDDHGHAPAPKAAAGSKMDDYIENVLFFPAGIMHNLVHIALGSVSGSISKTVIWDLHSQETDFKGGPIGKFLFGAAPFLLLLVSVWLYKMSTGSYGAWQGILFYLAFCAGFAAKPSGRDFKFMKEANTTLIAPISIPVNIFTEFYKKIFYGLVGNMAIGVGTYLLAFYI